MKIAALIGSIATLSTMIQMESKIDIVFKYNSSARYFWVDINYGGLLTEHEEHSAWLDEEEKVSEERLQSIIKRLSEIYQSIKQEVA
jgi:hypothetical protein